MGGRGGKGVRSGGGIGKAASAKMPELKGSQKQVSWAEQIRSDALKNVDLLVERASDTSKYPLKGIGLPQGGYVRPEAAKQVKDFLVSGFQRIDSASRIIDRRGDFSYSNIEKAMITAQIQINRGKR